MVLNSLHRRRNQLFFFLIKYRLCLYLKSRGRVPPERRMCEDFWAWAFSGKLEIICLYWIGEVRSDYSNMSWHFVRSVHMFTYSSNLWLFWFKFFKDFLLSIIYLLMVQNDLRTCKKKLKEENLNLFFLARKH